jgi:hypothetical protein
MLPVPRRFVTCAYCGAKLQIHRSSSAIYTEVLEAIDQRTQQMAADLDVIKRQNELEALDRQWMMQREQYMVRDKQGNASVPTAAGSMIGELIAAGFGIFWTITAASNGAPGFFVLFGLAFVVAAIVGGVIGSTKSGKYRSAERAYHHRREALLRDREPPDAQEASSRPS